MAPALNSQVPPVYSVLALKHSLPCSIISFMPAQSLRLDYYLQESKKNARSFGIPTVPKAQVFPEGRIPLLRAFSPAVGST